MHMTCPKCHGEMRVYERSGVTIDQCTECRGIFLDRGELEKLFAAEATYNRSQGGQVPPPPPPAPHQPPPVHHQQPGYAPPPPPPAYGAPRPHAYPPAVPAYGHHGHYRHGHHGHYRRRSFLHGLFD
ncbi:zf-TFIIB domain-containing protein [Actinoplanes couchii]|uniref:Transcriptional regulator n=1 Tax=Actinoplanes couchii TaxID=403638 RepID=A0ABQ3XJC1_9ACTN|nr:zf-TFIIB domain-containing protein [Actinoplanes couchii]MDR6324405.1 Zn-finger nucleic acid-binding protein [Actinoplanes couchii]GID58593.1 transcriptional regulator [Actinoplanes couchii]